MNTQTSKLNYFKTCIMGLGYFCINLSLCLYGPFVPLFINKYTDSKFIIGLITMSGYIIAAVFQPYFGAMSDKTSTRLGKRKPYLLIGMPLSAIFFLLIPFENSFLFLLTCILAFNLTISIYRVPAMSLMPDQTNPEHWNNANGIINFIGGIGALLAYFVGSILYDANVHYPFVFSSAVIIAAMLFIQVIIRENKAEAAERCEAGKEHVGVIKAFKEVLGDRDKSKFMLLMSIFFRFMGYNGIETFITLYGINYLHVKAGDAALLLGILALSFIISAIPSGMIATRIGQKKAIFIGLVMLAGVFLIDAVTNSFTVIKILAPFGGFGYALININAYPMLLSMVEIEKNGVYTGMYYFFYSIAAIAAPPLFGKLLDLFGFGLLFYISTALLLLAIISFYFVKDNQAVKATPQGEMHYE